MTNEEALVLGSWFLVLGFWFLVLGSWFLVLGSWFRKPYPLFFQLVTHSSEVPGSVDISSPRSGG